MSVKCIAVANDHGGLALKCELLPFLEKWGWKVEDLGCHSLQSVDYPQFALSVAERVAAGTPSLGLLICGSGIGMCIAANKVPKIRAALCHEPYSAKMAKAHNNANILCLGGRVIGVELARMVLETFLNTPFEGGRHQRRLDLIAQTETARVLEDT